MSEPGRRHFAVRATLGLIAVLALAGCEKSIDLPESLHGKYVTTHANYADRSFTLTPVEFSIDLGDRVQRYEIVKVLRDEDTGQAGKSLYTVVYLNDGYENKLSLYQAKNDPDRVMMKNQPRVVWTRKP